MERGTISGMLSVRTGGGRDPNPYLRKFCRKPRKTPKGLVDQRDQELKSVPPLSASGGTICSGEIKSCAIHRIIETIILRMSAIPVSDRELFLGPSL